MASPIRILIADDSVRARVGLRALLALRPEFDVVDEAVNGADALRLVAERTPDVVLMDIQMPVLDGLEATRLIKQRWPTLMVIVLTIYATQQSAALDAGADAFFVKGGNPDLLLAALNVVRHTRHSDPP